MAKFIVFALLSYQLLLPVSFNGKPLIRITAFSLQTPPVLVIQHCNVYNIHNIVNIKLLTSPYFYCHDLKFFFKICLRLFASNCCLEAD